MSKFKAAVVLFALTFEGCDWFKGSKNNENQVASSGDKIESEAEKAAGAKVLTVSKVNSEAEKAKTTTEVLAVSKVGTPDPAEANPAAEEGDKTGTAPSSEASSAILKVTGQGRDEKVVEIKQMTDEDVQKLKAEVDDTIKKFIKVLPVDEDRARAIITAAGEEVKKEIDEAKSKGQLLGEEFVGEIGKKISKNPEDWKLIMKGSTLMHIGMEPSSPNYHALVRIVTDAVSKAVDEFTAKGQPFDTETDGKAVIKSIYVIIVDELVKMYLGTTVEEADIQVEKSALMQEISTPDEERGYSLAEVFEEYFVPAGPMLA